LISHNEAIKARATATEIEPYLRDPHWNVQTQRLMLDLISYDFIGRYETFADDFATVLV